jgi:hypothetical protein
VFTLGDPWYFYQSGDFSCDGRNIWFPERLQIDDGAQMNFTGTGMGIMNGMQSMRRGNIKSAISPAGHEHRRPYLPLPAPAFRHPAYFRVNQVRLYVATIFSRYLINEGIIITGPEDFSSL